MSVFIDLTSLDIFLITLILQSDEQEFEKQHVFRVANRFRHRQIIQQNGNTTEIPVVRM